MIYTILFAITLCIISFIRYKKVGTIDVSMVMLVLYSAVAIICVYELAIGSKDYQLKVWDLSTWNIRLWPYLYLIILFLLFFRPILKYRSDRYVNRLYISSSLKGTLSVLSAIYIICAIISVYYSFTNFSVTLQSADFGEVYQDEIVQYANLLDGIAKRFTEYFRPVVFLASFYFLFKVRARKKFYVSVLVISAFCSLMISAMNASRNGAFSLIMLGAICLVLFWGDINRKEKKWILFFGILLTLVFIGYSYLVTIARFEEESTSSTLFYFGHSYLAFNYGIAGRMSSYSLGTYLFDWFLPFLGLSPVSPSATNVSGLFYTFIGSLYLDFGPYGTILVALLFPLLINCLLRPRNGRIDIASLYLYIFYAWRLMSGVFVYGKAEGFLWFVAFLIFIFLRLISKYNSRVMK